MIGNGSKPLESNQIDTGVATLDENDRLRRNLRPCLSLCGGVEQNYDSELEDLTRTDDEDEIFKMEFDRIGNDCTASRNEGRPEQGVKDDQEVDVQQRRPRPFYDFDDDAVRDGVTPLSASFVPPHQMVEHGCFSLGLRDQLKHKPRLHI